MNKCHVKVWMLHLWSLTKFILAYYYWVLNHVWWYWNYIWTFVYSFVLVGPCAFMTSLTFKLLMRSPLDEESITNATEKIPYTLKSQSYSPSFYKTLLNHGLGFMGTKVLIKHCPCCLSVMVLEANVENHGWDVNCTHNLTSCNIDSRISILHWMANLNLLQIC